MFHSFGRDGLDRPQSSANEEGQMRRLSLFIIVVLSVFMVSNVEGAVFDVSTVTELEDALIIAQNNHQG